ncbi:MAG TPA: LysR family transcriptional regulator [Candidatus Pelethenecus faecipullorum]|uniref:LysR family transcriptional regulator n=1 Tax=Candidatus Pelethenecus faecipullorum TaxID=2840900 RepID=A0A9D1KIP4_9MOLU|nr:LysR family transcriptional regulator [Candidatus Pelethenecus faecipullorum]
MIDSRIQTLISVCETKNYTKTASLLHLTQPAVSQQIKSLEKELNIKIFNRSANQLQLTQEGMIVLKYAKRIKTLYASIVSAIEDEKKNLKSLIVGVTPSAESNIISEVLAKYASEKGNIHIRIISDTIKNLYDKLKTYEIDIAVIEGSIVDNNFNSILLDTDYLALAVSNDNPLSKKTMVSLADLKKQNLILRLPGSGTRSLFESHLKSHNENIHSFNVTLEVDNIAIIKDLVQHNFGVSILAKSVCENEVKKGKFKLLPVENLSMIREVSLFYHKDFSHDDILNDITTIYRMLK